MVTEETNDAGPPRDDPDATPRTLHDLFRQVTASHPDEAAFRLKRGGRWIDVTWAAHRATVERIARSLLALGVEKGDRVAILSGTRLEWVQCDTAIVTIGAVTVGIYHSNLAAECAFVLDHSDAKVVFVENEEQLHKVRSERSTLPHLRHVVAFDRPANGVDGVTSWAAFLDGGADVGERRLEQAGRRIVPEDVATVVYTSGTTGVPKGVMITHANLLAAVGATTRALRFDPRYRTLLFLPLAHVFARLIVYVCQQTVLCIAFAEEIAKVPENLSEIRPHFVVSVPRIFEKIQEKIASRAEDAGGTRAALFAWAVAVGRQVARRRLAHERVPALLALKHAVADRLVLHRVRDLFGGRVVWAVSGAAPLNPTVNEFFHACGLPILEGIGMTENTSVSHVNRLDHNKIGTVGPPVPGVEARCAEDGEVLIRGPNVMKGYFKDPASTAEAIDDEGWLRTGDVGTIDDEGFLTITDRKKDLIVTAGGKNVAPQRIERAMNSSRYIAQSVACGDRRKFITALIALDAANIGPWAATRGLGGASIEELAERPEVHELIEAEITAANRELASFETVKRFRILPRELTIEGGELTPTLKVRRKLVYERYSDRIEQMYRE
jgi:long-chain acyl-CoA synthetase